MESDHLKAKLIMSVSMFFLFTVALVQALWHHRTRLRSAARKIIEKVCSCASRQKTVDPFEQRVVAACSQRRIERAQGAYFVLIFWGVMSEVFLIMVLLSSLRPSALEALEPTLRFRQAALIQAAYCVVLVISVCPRIITAKTIHFIYFTVIFIDVAAILIEDPKDSIMRPTDFRVWANVLFWCLFDLDIRANSVGMLLIAGAFTFMHMPHVFSGWGLSIFCIAICSWIEQVLKAGVRHEILAMDSGNQLTAITTLLSTICDVVVELDEGLRMMRHSPKLSDVLLSNSGRSLQGATVQEFMAAEEDREKFVGCLSGADNSSPRAEVFHATVSDCNATPIRMEFFSVAFTGPDTHQRYLLGMREFTDINPLTPSPESPQHGPPPVERTVRQSWPGTPAIPEQGDLMQFSPSGDLFSENSSSSSRQSASLSQEDRPRIETAKVAKFMTIASMLMSWYTVLHEDSCCPWHVRLEDLQMVVAEMVHWKCKHEFGWTDEWQCHRCGIISDENRQKGRRSSRFGCNLCKDVSVAPKHSGGEGAETRTMAL